jgi:hypothetical protein
VQTRGVMMNTCVAGNCKNILATQFKYGDNQCQEN